MVTSHHEGIMQLRDHGAVTSKRDYFIVDPRMLKVDAGYNIRDLTTPENREHIDALKESIGVNSVRVPLEVRLASEDIYIVAGHCRHVAVMELIAEGRDDIKGVPCIPESKSTNDAERTLNLAISNSGKPLTTLEIAEVVRRLEAFGWTENDIQKRMRWKSRASVTHHAEVSRLPEAIKTQIKQGEVSATTALRVSKNCDPDQAADFLKANREENRRLGVGAKNNFKVTAKTIKRDAPKVKPAPSPVQTTAAELQAVHADHIRTAAETPVPAATIDSVQSCGSENDYRNVPPTLPPAAGWEHFDTTRGTPHVPAAPLRPNIKDLIEALEPFANLAHEQNFDERGDHDLIEVPFHYLKKAWIIFAKATGTANV